MNIVIIHGRVARDIEIKTTPGGKRYCRFPVAVNRPPTKDGEKKADFPMVLAWDKTADFLEKYFLKGKEILVTGKIQTSSYEKDDGTKVYTTDIRADRVEFCGSSGGDSAKNAHTDGGDSATDIPF